VSVESQAGDVRECEACPTGTFSTGVNAAACVAWTRCASDEYESKSPTARADRECTPLTICASGYQVAEQATTTSDRQCEVCPDGTYSNEENSASCSSWSTCTSDEYESQSPSAASNRQCTALGDCAPGWYVSAERTQDAERQCEPCPNGKFSATVNAASCAVWAACESDEYEAAAPSASADRQCVPHEVCSAGYQVSVEPTATTNRKCELCPYDTFSTQENAAACEDGTVCADDEYESRFLSATSDRQCTALTICGAGYQVAIEPTPTTDRVCEACPSGTFSTEENTSLCADWTPACADEE
jgi:hypothetical protein